MEIEQSANGPVSPEVSPTRNAPAEPVRNEMRGTDEPRWASELAFHDREFSNRARVAVSGFYSVTRKSFGFFAERLSDVCTKGPVLEYGCGPWSMAYDLARRGVEVTGIDLSPVAIDQSRAAVQRERCAAHFQFEVMNAEALRFASQSFEVVCGTGILHHLDLERAYSEIARVLTPSGTGIFLEPLGHNPLINLFRKRTPHLRTVDEHPLLEPDLERAKRWFDKVDVHVFHLCSLVAAPFRKMPGFEALLGVLERMDESLFRLAPPMRKHAWMVALELTGPRGDRASAK